METNLVVEGFKFMLLGMGTVFAFLVLMIFAMNIMSRVIHRFFPEPVASPSAPAQSGNDKAKVVAAITAAIKFHRESK